MSSHSDRKDASHGRGQQLFSSLHFPHEDAAANANATLSGSLPEGGKPKKRKRKKSQVKQELEAQRKRIKLEDGVAEEEENVPTAYQGSRHDCVDPTHLQPRLDGHAQVDSGPSRRKGGSVGPTPSQTVKQEPDLDSAHGHDDKPEAVSHDTSNFPLYMRVSHVPLGVLPRQSETSFDSGPALASVSLQPQYTSHSCHDTGPFAFKSSQTIVNSTETPQHSPSHLPSFQAGHAECFTCRKPVMSDESLVMCACPQCPPGQFHKVCVGLSSRKDPTNWRCWLCRTPPQLLPLAQPSVTANERPDRLRSSPPLLDIIPTSAPRPLSHNEPQPPLAQEQIDLVNCIVGGANVFYTGSAGTGKSTVLRSFVQELRSMGKQVDIVAPTGIAALNVGGTTMFAYGGFHPDSCKEPLEDFLGKSWSKSVRKRLFQTDVLVIDEISMVERDMFTRLDLMMREVRRHPRYDVHGQSHSPRKGKLPFGGAQVVVTGDFCQLPPVKPFKYCLKCGGDELPGHKGQEGKPLICPKCKAVNLDEEKWAFCSEEWKACQFRCFGLKKIHRQEDEIFVRILEKCRYGQPLSIEDRATLLQPKPDPKGAVKLLPRKKEVHAENARHFDALPYRARTYACQDAFIWNNEDEPDLPKKYNKRLYPERSDGPLKALEDHRFEEQVQLKIGQLVILVVNLDIEAGLVNGSQGEIIGFEAHSNEKVFPPKTFSDSPRKRIGTAVDERTKSDREYILRNQVDRFIRRNAVTQWPVVRFNDGQIQPIYAFCQTSLHGSEPPYSFLCRTQVPLLAAWAITIHKSQGMTLSRVVVSLGGAFEAEQVYVALSRARGLEGLKVVGLAEGLEGRGMNGEVRGFLAGVGLYGGAGGVKGEDGVVVRGEGGVAMKLEDGVSVKREGGVAIKREDGVAVKLEGGVAFKREGGVAGKREDGVVIKREDGVETGPETNLVPTASAKKTASRSRVKRELSPVMIWVAGRGAERFRE